MLNKTKHLVGLGFLLILVLMLALVFVTLTQISKVNRELETVVTKNNLKISAAYTMRDAINKRAIILRNARLSEDPFEVDGYTQSFYHEAEKYRQARMQLIELGLDEQVDFLLKQLSDTAEAAQPFSDYAMELLIEGATDAEITSVMQRAAEMQDAVSVLLDDLIELEEKHAKHAVESANNSYMETRDLVYLIASIVLIISIVVSVAVIQMSSRNTRMIQYEASHDSLTGLVNRREFERVLTNSMTMLSGKQQHALLFMDLDDFKVVNDSCGHAAGDQLLKDLAQSLSASIRQTDVLARVGGDEFSVLLHDCDLEAAYTIAEKLRHEIADFPFRWESERFTIGVSIGLVMIDENAPDISQLLKDVDSACYTAKDTGRNRVCIYQKDDSEIIKREHEISWVGRIKDAIFRNQLLLMVQPIEYLPSGSVTHYEVLLRMHDEEGKLIRPHNFLPAAEKFHLMEVIDEWVVRHVIRHLEHHPELWDAQQQYNINLSGASLNDAKFIDALDRLLRERPQLSRHLCFEVTETVAIANIARTRKLLAVLRKNGCYIALDDFGVGMSSFTYLKSLELDYVKIDGSFIRDILNDEIDREVVRLMNDFCHTVDVMTVAEYVSSKDIYHMVGEMGIDFAQGDYVGEPVPLNT